MGETSNADLAMGFLNHLIQGDGALTKSLISDNLQHDFSRAGIEVALEGENSPEARSQHVHGAGVEIHHAIRDGDTVAARISYDLNGDDVGHSNGQATRVSGMVMCRVENDQVVEIWHEHAVLSALLELGWTLHPPA